MKHAIVTHDIGNGAIDKHSRTHAIGNLKVRNSLSSRGIDRAYRAGIVCNNTVVARERHTGPVIALAVLVLVPPHNLAVSDTHAKQVAVT